jgi:glycosyltransferase involved in cell wall biosynthesis
MKQFNKKFILLANYRPDRQESMQRYALNLRDSLAAHRVEAEIWYPTVFFGTFLKNTNAGVGKWLAYLDKYMLFPVLLWLRIRFNPKYAKEGTFFHVCDHSNSPYLGFLPSRRSGITCHDVLAIRGSMGFQDAFCPASPAGKILQRWILTHLRRAKILIAVSQYTMNGLLELCNHTKPLGARWKMIYNSFNGHFRPMPLPDCQKLIAAHGLPAGTPFILSVGSASVRKNRKLLLEMAHCLGKHWEGRVCFAGHAMEPSLLAYAEKLGLKDRISVVVNPGHDTLVALYSACTAFVFPSFSEGFGWPLIEAQACGAPVLASNLSPMPEISKGSAIHVNPHSPSEFALAFLELLVPEKRDNLVKKGFENCKRFRPQLISRQFLDLYSS